MKKQRKILLFISGKKIWACGKKYREYQGKYPVIFITFKDIKFNTWEETFDAIKDVFSKETHRHSELRTSDRCDEYDKKIFDRLLSGEVNEVELSAALLNLSRMLHWHYGIAPIIIIDEYDIPVQQGYMRGYYDKVILFMRNLFSGGLKDNKHLSFGFLTGILRVAKESIFSGLNNLTINSVLDNKYSSYFGFTSEEVKEMAEYYGASDKYGEICEWYDGYRFGKTDIFNPWSVINYFNNECEPRAFWQSTAVSIQEAVFSGNNRKLKTLIQTLLTQSVSSFDTAGENFYHGFMLGLCALLGEYFVSSNRESGDGRYDIQLKKSSGNPHRTESRKKLPGRKTEKTVTTCASADR